MLSSLSKIHSLPIIGNLLTKTVTSFTEEQLKGFAESQELAIKCAREVAALVQPGWSEKKTANLVDKKLKDAGVESFFHHAFCWYEDRSRFDGMRTKGLARFNDFSPTDRKYKEGEVIMIDVAPIYKGFASDIGINFLQTDDKVKQEKYDKATAFVATLRNEIPKMFECPNTTGAEIYKKVDEMLEEQGYENRHCMYPLGILAHRLYPMKHEGKAPAAQLFKFGWHAYWGFISRGFFPETLNATHTGKLDGLWAIEPHLGCDGFGVKFEEMLWVKDGKAIWLREKGYYDE